MVTKVFTPLGIRQVPVIRWDTNWVHVNISTNPAITASKAFRKQVIKELNMAQEGLFDQHEAEVNTPLYGLGDTVFIKSEAIQAEVVKISKLTDRIEVKSGDDTTKWVDLDDVEKWNGQDSNAATLTSPEPEGDPEPTPEPDQPTPQSHADEEADVYAALDYILSNNPDMGDQVKLLRDVLDNQQSLLWDSETAIDKASALILTAEARARTEVKDLEARIADIEAEREDWQRRYETIAATGLGFTGKRQKESHIIHNCTEAELNKRNRDGWMVEHMQFIMFDSIPHLAAVFSRPVQDNPKPEAKASASVPITPVKVQDAAVHPMMHHQGVVVRKNLDTPVPVADVVGSVVSQMKVTE